MRFAGWARVSWIGQPVVLWRRAVYEPGEGHQLLAVQLCQAQLAWLPVRRQPIAETPGLGRPGIAPLVRRAIAQPQSDGGNVGWGILDILGENRLAAALQDACCGVAEPGRAHRQRPDHAVVE